MLTEQMHWISEKRVLIHHDGALGDTLLSLPCIGLIRHSASFIHIVGRTDIAEFLRETGLADEISSADSAVYSSLYMDTMDESLSDFLTAYDAIYLFTVNRDSRIAGNMQRISPSTTIINTVPPNGCIEHAAEYRLRQYGNSRKGEKSYASIQIPAEAMAWAGELLKSHGYMKDRDMLCAIHPGSGGRKKCWPWKNYETLISMITEEPHVFCVVFSGPAEDDQMVQDMLRLAQNNKRILHLHQQPLVRIAAILNASDFYAGNDSGVSHLAGAIQCRGVVLFGPTEPRLWRPYGSRLEVLHFDSEGARDVMNENEVCTEITRRLHTNEWRGGRGSNPRPPA